MAGRVTRQYNRPCIVLGNEGDLAKGSGRSIDGVSLVEILGGCSSSLTAWGGHPMAVGISIKKTEVDAFRLRFAEAIRAHTGSGLIEAKLDLATWLTADQINERLMDELAGMHPFGQGNPEPVFGVRGVVFRNRPEVFKAKHFRFSFDDGRGRRLHGVAWKMAHNMPPMGKPVDLAIELTWNHFNDRKLLQLELIDWRLSDS